MAGDDFTSKHENDDSTPGAIKVPCFKNGLDPSTNLNETAETDAQIKRYLQCPGMCRVEVLKKFVRNKYQVDTNKFYIDVLYKRVPLPDHYTLIDIAYIYSWKRNEPMKFYFRITDLNKVAERFDYFDASKPVADVFQMPVSVRVRNHNSERERTPKNNKRGTKRAVDNHNKATASHSTPKSKKKNKMEKEKPSPVVVTPAKPKEVNGSDIEKKMVEGNDGDEAKKDHRPENDLASMIKNEIQTENGDVNNPPVYTNITLNRTNNVEIITKIQKVSNREGQPIGLNIIKQTVKKGPKVPNSTKAVDSKPAVDSKSAVVDSKPRHNVESNNRTVPKLIIRTDADNKVVVSEKLPDDDTSRTASSTTGDSKHGDNRNKLKTVPSNDKNASKTTKEPTKTIILSEMGKRAVEKKADVKIEPAKFVIDGSKGLNHHEDRTDVEKSEFLKSIQLTARNAQSIPCVGTADKLAVEGKDAKPSVAAGSLPLAACTSKSLPSTAPRSLPSTNKVSLPSTSKSTMAPAHGNQTSQKRKPASPIKSERAVKKAKVEKKPIKKIILQSKTPLPSPVISKMLSNVNQSATNVSKIVEQTTSSKSGNADLQSLFDNCKINIPSSLSITLKEGSENEVSPGPIPPVKNYIQILKLPDNDPDKHKSAEQKNKTECSESHKAKRDEPFNREGNILIVKKLKTEPGANKPQPILPSPVPELPCKLLNIPKDSLNKLSPRSPQTFQKIFEESIKKPDAKSGTPEEKSPNNGVSSEPVVQTKRNISEIASQLFKKNSKLEMEKRNETNTIKAEEKLEKLPNITTGKVAIPRLPTQKSAKAPKKAPPKFELLSNNCGPQSYANLHSNALGLNYTVSISQNGSSNNSAPTKTIQLDDKAEQKPTMETASRFNVFTSNQKSQSSEKEEEEAVKETKSEVTSPVPVGKNGQLQNAEGDKCKQEASAIKPVNNEPSETNKTNCKESEIAAQSSKQEQKKPRKAVSCGKSSGSVVSPRQAGLVGSGVPVAAKTPPQIKPATSTSGNGSPLNPNQLLEKYNIQNLAQLTASFNFNPATIGLSSNQQMAAIQQAMLLKHIELQNRQNWFSINQNPVLQYENYLNSLNQGHVLGNIKEN